MIIPLCGVLSDFRKVNTIIGCCIKGLSEILTSYKQIFVIGKFLNETEKFCFVTGEYDIVAVLQWA